MASLAMESAKPLEFANIANSLMKNKKTIKLANFL
jgi:hypothetical protein